MNSWIVALLTFAAAALAGGGVWFFLPRLADSAGVIRTTITLPSRLELDAVQTTAPLALSHDGRRLAYVGAGDGRTQLFVRNLDAFEARAIEGTDGAQYPFFSPDGQWVAFFADAKLKRVAIGGGAPIVVSNVPMVGRGGTWSADGTIVFAGLQSGLFRVPAEGGQPVPVASRDATMTARRYAWPQFLPDGRGLLSTVDNDVALLSFATGEWKVLLPGSQPQYSSGYLMFHAPQVREGQINAVPFDAATMTTRGTPVPVLDGAFRSANGGAAFFAVSQTGTLIFAPGGFARTLVRVDRQGRRTPLVNEHRGFRFPRYSPDGRKVMVTIDPRPSQIWAYDLERGSRLPITTSGHNLTGVWSPDGQRVAFSGGGVIKSAPADGGAIETLVSSQDAGSTNINPTSWSADGRFFIFQEQTPATDYDIWLMVKGDPPRKIISTPVRDLGARLSPDAHWIAYYSNESGRHEVYVRPFPNVNDHKWMISTNGGWTPVWSPDGRELFYVNGSEMIAVSITAHGADFSAGKPEQLFDGPFDTTQDMNFDIAPDATHFVMVEADPDAKPTRINVAVNWIDDVRRTAPATHP
jgi:serine/threonine-protein kinase